MAAFNSSILPDNLAVMFGDLLKPGQVRKDVNDKVVQLEFREGVLRALAAAGIIKVYTAVPFSGLVVGDILLKQGRLQQGAILDQNVLLWDGDSWEDPTPDLIAKTIALRAVSVDKVVASAYRQKMALFAAQDVAPEIKVLGDVWRNTATKAIAGVSPGALATWTGSNWQQTTFGGVAVTLASAVTLTPNTEININIAQLSPSQPVGLDCAVAAGTNLQVNEAGRFIVTFNGNCSMVSAGGSQPIEILFKVRKNGNDFGIDADNYSGSAGTYGFFCSISAEVDLAVGDKLQFGINVFGGPISSATFNGYSTSVRRVA